MQYNKRCVVSISTLSFVILILFLMFIFTYNYYVVYIDKIDEKTQKIEILNSIGNFRSQIYPTIMMSNSSINYTNSMDNQNIIINLNNTTIEGEIITIDERIAVNISTMGIQFCDSYKISSLQNNILTYNNTCVSVTTS
ncbi:MAG: hypothetical protein ACOCP8_08590 [archaeon]